jgi:hypothetical protein
MNNITIPVSIGELLDKITILEIKKEKITDGAKLNNIKKELDFLVLASKDIPRNDIRDHVNNLKSVNLLLWDIEEKKRLKEKQKCFDQEFIELSRSVYIYNDKRAEIKKQINQLTNSSIVEEKSYD